MSEFEEVAKATQEVAKATSNAIDTASELGKFISGPVKEGLGIIEDKLKFMRWERRIRLISRANEFLIEQKLEFPNKPLPLKNAIPLLEYASLEEDDKLQDIWAQLLVNGTCASTGIILERSFIEVLSQISSLEILILQKIYEIPIEELNGRHILTKNLPNYAIIQIEQSGNTRPVEPEEDIKMALSNLVRLNCLRFVSTWGGGELYSIMNTTLFGRKLFIACTRK